MHVWHDGENMFELTIRSTFKTPKLQMRITWPKSDSRSQITLHSFWIISFCNKSALIDIAVQILINRN